MITLPVSAVIAINELQKNGYEAYAVGGCVRDALMGLPINDFDITTSATPEQTLSVFSDLRTIPTGLKHGTVTVLIDGEPIEITTFRADGDYRDHRHPETVSFSKNIEDDLCRRDFTVNAMAYNEKSGIIDLYGGKEDIKNKLIRAVGDPERRFTEDALRILRAVRFASQKCFSIEPKTLEAMKKCLPLLSFVSAERVFSELKKLLMGKGVLDVMLSYPFVITAVIPALSDTVGFDQHSPHHLYDVYGHTAHAVANSPYDETVRLAALLHDAGKPRTFTLTDGVGHFYGHTDASLDLAEQTLLSLKCDNATKNDVLTLIKYHDPVIEPTEKTVKRALNKLGKPLLLKLLELKSADNLAQTPEHAQRLTQYENIRQIISEIEKQNACFSLKDLQINGDVLISLGFSRGKTIGATLTHLLNLVIDGKLPNEKHCLISAAMKLKGDVYEDKD